MKLQIYLSRHAISLNRVDTDCTHTHSKNTILEKISKLAKPRSTKLGKARI